MAIDVIAQYPLAFQPICFSKFFNFSPFRGKIRVSGNIEPQVDYYLTPPMDNVQMSIESGIYLEQRTEKNVMVTWDAFMEYVMPHVQGCPVSMVRHAIKSACIDFCAKTLIWKQDSILNDVVAGEALYAFAPPTGTKVVTPYKIAINIPNVDGTTYQTKELKAYSLEELESFKPNWREIKTTIPDSYVLVSDDTVRLVGTPTEDIQDSLWAGVALKPSRNAAECPEFILEDWAETIAAGALANLHANTEKVWANPDLVPYYTRIYRDGISRAKSKTAKSWLRESKNMLPAHMYNLKGYY